MLRMAQTILEMENTSKTFHDFGGLGFHGFPSILAEDSQERLVIDPDLGPNPQTSLQSVWD